MTDTVYQSDYVNVFLMRDHDSHDALRRWFDNYKIDRNEYIGWYDWVTIEEDKTIKQYVGTIGADHKKKEEWRTTRFEVGAPSPPTFFAPAKEKYVPPPPRDPTTKPSFQTIWEREEQYRRWELAYRYQQKIERWHDRMIFVDHVPLLVKPKPPRHRTN